jgi:hypothetical protein
MEAAAAASAENTLLLNYPNKEEAERSATGKVPLSCYAAVSLLCPSANRIKLFQVANAFALYFENNNFVDFVQKYYHQVEMLCRNLQRRLVVMKKNSNEKVYLMHDSHQIFSPKWPLHCWVFDTSGRLTKWSRKAKKLPKLSAINFDCCTAAAAAAQPANLSLWNLINAKINHRDGPQTATTTTTATTAEKENPKDKKELETFLRTHWPGENFRVYFITVMRPKPSNYIPWFNIRSEACGRGGGANRPLSKAGINIVVHSGSDFQLVYHQMDYFCDFMLKRKRKKAPGEEREESKNKKLKLDNGQKERKEEEEERQLQMHPFKKNKSSAVSVQLMGLSLAARLGLIDLEEMNRLSSQLAECVVALYSHFDAKGHLRHLTLCTKDGEGNDNFFHRELTCKNETNLMLQWQEIFNYLLEKQRHLANKKKQILASLLRALDRWVVDVDPKKTLSSLHSKCRSQLETCVSQHKIILFSPSDTLLHGIKTPLLHYVNHYLKTSKRTRSFQMKAISGNNLSALVCPELVVVNMASYFEGCTTQDLLGRSAKSTHFVVPWCVNRLGDHKSVQDPLTGEDGARVLHICRSLGEFLTSMSVKLWTVLNGTLLHLFDFDAASLSGFTPMPAMAFKCIWLKCAEKSGIFHQSIEKMKPFNEKMIRDHCRGGFSYSCREKLSEGDPLWPREDPHGPFGHFRASGLVEIDIVSSYGYAASQMLAPKGFCKGFIARRKDDVNGTPPLIMTDVSKRHNSYEFLCVYYALYIFREKRHMNIRSVFSNFHALGIYYVGPYPLDLVIVEEGGYLILLNFDGQFCHGCPNDCPPLERYASGKTHQQVREETRLRDRTIREWVGSACKNAERETACYISVSDCHDKDFNVKNLQAQFGTIEPLMEIMKPYRDMEDFSKLLLSATTTPRDILSQCPDSVTYIVSAQCKTANLKYLPKSAPTGPLFVCGESSEEGEASSKLYRRQTGTLSPGESVILTKDYFNYLLSSRESGFTVEKILGCLLYPRWREFNNVFAELVELRNSDHLGSAEKRVLKNVVNYACGYFGLNAAKEKMRHPKMRLGTKVKSTINLNKTMIFSVESFDASDYIIFHSVCKAPRKYSSPVPVPLYLGVVEMGKLRLLQILDWLEMGSVAGSVRHLYTNVDNLILALAAPDLDSLPSPRPATFSLLKNFFFNGGEGGGEKPLPGGLKLEWQVGGPGKRWQFASCALQNWAVVTEGGDGDDGEDARSKTNLFAGVSARRSYENACKMLDNEPVTLQVQRRVNKMVGTQEHVVQIKFVPK